MTVNTSDIAAKAQEDTGAALTPAGIEKLAMNGRSGGGGAGTGLNKKHANGNVVMTEELKEELEEVHAKLGAFHPATPKELEP